jgi:hypothetical protein
MTDRAQFEAMLEALINDDQQAAKEIFHNIVVGKSREIYESLLESDFGDEEPAMEEEADDEESAPKAKDQGNPYGSDDEESDDEEDTDSEEDDAEGEEDGEEDGDMDMDMGDDDGAEGGDIEDRVMDLEDALEDLKAEFEQLMADEENEPEHHDGMTDPAFGDDAMGGGDMGGDLETELMEYVNKVGTPTPGDNGTNTRSLIDNMKNDMGGTTANIAKNFSTTTGGTEGGLLKPSTAKLDGGNVNVPGNKKAPAYKNDGKGHGAEKKGARPGQNVGAETGENSRDGEKNKQSVLRPVKK